MPWYDFWSPKVICTQASLERVVAHEMAHLAYNITDENNVIQSWENPIMRDLGENRDRISHASQCAGNWR